VCLPDINQRPTERTKHMARKPNYNFEKRRKELARKEKQEQKRSRKERDTSDADTDSPSLNSPIAPNPPSEPATDDRKGPAVGL